MKKPATFLEIPKERNGARNYTFTLSKVASPKGQFWLGQSVSNIYRIEKEEEERRVITGAADDDDDFFSFPAHPAACQAQNGRAGGWVSRL